MIPDIKGEIDHTTKALRKGTLAPHLHQWTENSAVGTGLEKVSFHSDPKERQCQRMLKLLQNCTHLTHYQSNAQNSPSQASAICEP